jgi:hypothetical protein
VIQDGTVAASTSTPTLSAIVPNGKRVLLQRFGGCSGVTAGFCAIQWGDAAGGWTTIRAISGTAEFIINQEFTGNGVKRFRTVRQNDTTTAKYMAAWAEALVMN